MRFFKRGVNQIFQTIPRANVPIVFDIFPRSMENLYWYDTTRAVVRGKATPEARRLYETVRKTQTFQLSLVKSGANGYEIHETGKKMLEDYGYKTGFQKTVINGKEEMRIQGFFHGTGHGVGVDIHEEPRIAAKKRALSSRAWSSQLSPDFITMASAV